jgi:hypothetical protein
MGLQVKRLRNALTKQQELCESYVPPERKVKQRVGTMSRQSFAFAIVRFCIGLTTNTRFFVGTDPNWVLKGAARPAQEYYKPPAEPEPVPENILETYAGMWCVL